MFRLAISLTMLAPLAQVSPTTGPADVAAPAAQTAPAATPPAATAAPAAPANPAVPAASTTQPAAPTVGPATAQAVSGAAAPTSKPISALENFIGNFNPLFLIILALGVMMFFQVRSKRNQEKAQKERLNAIKRGDRVQTIGGILGNVVQTEERRVLVKVDESNNTKIWFARDAIRGVLEEDKSEGKDTKGGK